jgi:hypothetical protein
VQVDPIKPTLKPPGSKRLKLIYDGPLSISVHQVERWAVQVVPVKPTLKPLEIKHLKE